MILLFGVLSETLIFEKANIKMPTLNWIGKDKIINHHLVVPYKVLNHQYHFPNFSESEFSKLENFHNSENLVNSVNSDSDKLNSEHSSGNMIINGDNLEALKSLLPQYEGKVNCIYIDPPYNTGNESWVYNDNVNSPQIKKWLGKVVGKESEDLTRHDKWLCMMYPRLKLLHKLLANDGAIFISIDDNEQASLKLMCDEIFGNKNFLGNIVRATGTTTGQDTNGLGKAYDHIVCYSKSSDFIVGGVVLTLNDIKRYNLKDEKGYFSILQLRRTGGEDRREDRPTMFFSIKAPDGEEIFPIGPTGYESRWRVGPETVKKMLLNNELFFKKDKNKEWKVYYKYYLENRTKRPSNFWNDIEGNKKAQIDIKNIFKEKVFETPKPIELLDRVIQIATSPNSIILDSFAGSGTTAHAVLNLNKQDGGNRKFILIEMEDYAETITAERVKRVINGYADKEGTGGSFDYYTLGEPLFDENNNLNESVGETKIREYVWFTETRSIYSPLNHNALNEFPFMGIFNDTSYYFIYNQQQSTTLDYDSLADFVNHKTERYVIYADNCLLPEAFMRAKNIEFKKIPRDITRF